MNVVRPHKENRGPAAHSNRIPMAQTSLQGSQLLCSSQNDTHLSPRQLGVGITGGAEAAVHASRRYLADLDSNTVFVKLDISNAFNSLHRDRMLSSIDTLLPEIAHYCHLAYAEPSQLKFGKYTILSMVDPQQRDPLGPLLFCLPLQPALLKLTSPLAFGYLDDISLGGPSRPQL